MIRITSRGDFKNFKAFAQRILKNDLFSELGIYGLEGVRALASATPVNTGLTASSWEFRVTNTNGQHGVEWYNTNLVNGTPVAILIQYGHGTGTGGYVQGRDFINPALQPIFDRIADDIWKKVNA